MLPASIERVERLPHAALVLDIGGWAKPLSRADWVLDQMPHQTRGLYGQDGNRADERFTADTWRVLDVCAREPWPFDDGHFDFVVCSHTLEDIRDPLWVCSEMQRVAKAGYVEVPSRLEEQSWGVQGPWVGWGHHRWLTDVVDGGLVFTIKHHILHGKPELHFPEGFADLLLAEERVETLWWEGSLPCEEQYFYEPEELDHYLGNLVTSELARRGRPRGARVRARVGALRRGVRQALRG